MGFEVGPNPTFYMAAHRAAKSGGWLLAVGGLALAMAFIPFAADLFVARLELVEFFVGEVLDIDHLIVSVLDGADHLVELQVQRLCVPVLRVLDKEDD